MIDIHTHVLPGVDDGSPDLETSIKLIESEMEQGVTDIFVTPHYYRLRGFMCSANETKEIFNDLVEETKKRGMKVNLFLGNEIYYDKSTTKNLEQKIVNTMEDSRYVLVEFSLGDELEDIPEAINNLTAKGYIPIIAHPERYPYMMKLEAYRFLRRMGAMIQINSGSIVGYYGRKIKKFVKKLIEENLVDFVASDIHDFRHGYIKDAYTSVTRDFSKETADRLFSNRCIFT